MNNYNLPYAAIVLAFIGLTIAGFMGLLKPKPAPPDVEASIQIREDAYSTNVEQVIVELEMAASNRAVRVSEYNDRIHQLVYVASIAGYCAATNGVPFERISNSVHRIVADHFEIK